jgi:hypothetical protein
MFFTFYLRHSYVRIMDIMSILQAESTKKDKKESVEEGVIWFLIKKHFQCFFFCKYHILGK